MSSAGISPATARRELARRELARRSYLHYLAYVNAPLWRRTRMSDFLAREVQGFLEARTGGAYDILLLETPPQHGKSMTLTEALPSWYMGRWPNNRVILVSYNDEYAERFARRNREKLRTWGPMLFGVEPGGVNRATEFELVSVRPAPALRGRLISRGVKAGITGNPAELMLIDDPIKTREDADSPTWRQKLWGEWVGSMKTRLQAGSKVIIIMTPWHEDDFASRILRTEKRVRLIRLPVEAETDDPLGRLPGEPLCPELGKDAVWLAQFKESYINDPLGGARAWQSLYMCRPRAEEGNLVRRDWWRFYDRVPAFERQIISVDAAFKSAANNDFVAITVWGQRGQDCYLLSCKNEHLDFTQTLAAIRRTRTEFPEARTVLIEDKANGPAIINVLQREMLCVPIDPQGGKEARVNAVSSSIESGHVFLPSRAVWLEPYLDQWSAFPNGEHDDMVDSSSQALAWIYRFCGIPQSEPVLTEADRMRQWEQDAEREMLMGTGDYNPYEY